MRLILVMLLFGGVVALLFWYSRRGSSGDSKVAQPEARVAAEAPAIPTEKLSVRVYLPSADAHGLMEGGGTINDVRYSLPLWMGELLSAMGSISAQGTVSIFPPGVVIRKGFLGRDGTLYVDLPAAAYAFFQGGVEMESLAVEAVVRTLLTNIDGAKRVKFLVDGGERETFAGHVDLRQPIGYR